MAASSAPRVVLVVGPLGVGKTSLVQWACTGACPPAPAATVGIDTRAGSVKISPLQEDLTEDLAAELPKSGLELQMWEIGGREPEREAPRGQPLAGLLVCYDATSRASFHRAAHVLLRYRMDSHLQHARAQGHVPAPQRFLPAVLCGTKADLEGDQPAVAEAEVRQFVVEHQLAGAFRTSARTGVNISLALQAIALASLQADSDLRLRQQASAEVAATAAAEAFALPGASEGSAACMTSPRGVRPHEPPRGLHAQALVEVLPADCQGGALCAPRSVAACLERGLLHRAVHVWIWVPRQGALLLRRYAADALKHPGCWGPTVHGEVRCYGSGGDGHASELSAQAATRSLQEQVGVEAKQLTPLDHWFSCRSREGTCNELVDVYVAALDSRGLPELCLHRAEEVDWVYYEDALSAAAVEAGTIFHMEEEYRSSFLRRLREHAVPEDVLAAFGRTPGFEGNFQCVRQPRGVRAK